MSEKKKFNFCVAYTDGGYRQHDEIDGAGVGIHGYLFNEMVDMRYAGVDHLVTPYGYEAKPTGAQLKDPKYNPEYCHFGIALSLKTADGKAQVAKEWEHAVVFDAWMGRPAPVTAQRAELLAFVEVMQNSPFEFEEIIVHSDSAYLVDGYNKYMSTWEAAGWLKPDKTPREHMDLWKVISAIKTEWGERCTLRKIKAHNGHAGNEYADRNATYGVASAMNGHIHETKWVQCAFMDRDYWSPSKSIPELLRLKWIYTLTGREVPTWSVSKFDEEDYKTPPVIHYQYFFGDHNKDKDSIELLGNADPETLLGIALMKERVPLIDRMAKYHEDVMWHGVNKMYQYDTMQLINASNIGKPKVLWEMDNVGPESLWLRNQRNEVISISDAVISVVQRPPKLSYRALEEEESLVRVLRSALMKLNVSVMHATDNAQVFVPMQVNVEDLTDKFFEYSIDKKGVAVCKMTDFYDGVAKSIELDLINNVGGRTLVIFGRGLEIPPRNLINSLVDMKPRIYAVTWQFSKDVFRYALMINTDDAYSIWAGSYRNYRHVIELDADISE